MLQMKCPECEGAISSPFLIEIGTITCEQCGETVAVQDVFVTTRGFTMHRDTLLERVRHYRVLLKDVAREIELLSNSDQSSTEPQKGLEQYYKALQELLEAARENYRLAITNDLPLEMEWPGVATKGKLVNLSTKGAAIQSTRDLDVPKQGAEIDLRLPLPEQSSSPLPIAAKVAWVDKSEALKGRKVLTLGIRFINLNEKTRQTLWSYIVDSYQNSFARDNKELSSGSAMK